MLGKLQYLQQAYQERRECQNVRSRLSLLAAQDIVAECCTVSASSCWLSERGCQEMVAQAVVEYRTHSSWVVGVSGKTQTYSRCCDDALRQHLPMSAGSGDWELGDLV